ncbi:DUF1778 domain-containing protein [Methylicorpusculum oleiharenae]|uniref:type II toxin-antitoxin system TacA family antitoxin n=1 Tax=Methylicorpusculum oleiharenae TaxID=1338687 RepID=UPI00135B78CD|nr:DUF1778 domain-containing protein [Methylicorpusculum oleiharenae]MCD2452594.1 DUF1778 domain-containing protein [Methylicorpusculum oleiharenae]
MTTSLPRITARVDADTQDLLTKATVISGMSSINSFVLSAAVEKAKQLIEQDKTLKLTEQDALLLMDALDKPATTNSNLKAAAACYENSAR